MWNLSKMESVMYVILFLMCLSSTFARENGKHFEDDDSKVAERFNDQLQDLTSVEKRSFASITVWQRLPIDDVRLRITCCGMLVHSACNATTSCYNDCDVVLGRIYPIRPKDCDKGWHKESVFCYRILQIKATWDKAHHYCTELDGNSDLVDIRSPEEQHFVEWFLRHNNVHMPIWTGGEKIKGQWIWSSDQSPLKYTNWASYEPKRGDYMALDLSFRWFSDYAESQFFCMCKKPLL